MTRDDSWKYNFPEKERVTDVRLLDHWDCNDGINYMYQIVICVIQGIWSQPIEFEAPSNIYTSIKDTEQRKVWVSDLGYTAIEINGVRHRLPL